jgi:hypothetical protein
MEQKKTKLNFCNDPVLNSIMETMGGMPVFSSEYQKAKSCDDLLMTLAQAMLLVAEIIMQKVQEDKFFTNLYRRLFIEVLKMIRDGLTKEIRKNLTPNEAKAIADRASIFACVIFADINNYTSNQKEALLKDYLEAEKTPLKEFNEQIMWLLNIVEIPPDSRTAVPLVILLSQEPWQRVEIFDFVKCWENLPASERFVFNSRIGR